MDEIRSILLSWVSMSSVLTYRERLLPSRALLISSGKKVVFRLLEVPAFTLAICAPFLGAELDKEFAPSSPTEFFICKARRIFATPRAKRLDTWSKTLTFVSLREARTISTRL